MAFTDTRIGSGDPATIVAVAALHGAAIYALITGLGAGFITERIVNLPTRAYPADPPPPQPVPEPEPQQNEKTDDFVDVVEMPIPLPPVGGAYTVELDSMPIPIPDLFPNKHITPIPQPKPGLAPIGAKPKSSPGGWVFPNDYPTRDIRQGNEGTARFSLTIDAKGKVQDCRITSTSGHPGLDVATCKFVSRRARFEPATNSTGKRVAGTYSNTIRWVIPD